MANRQPSSQVEDQDSQPSSSGYPLEVTVNEESPGPSGEGAGTRRNFRGLTSKEERVQRSGRSACLRSEVYETGKGRGVSGGRRSRGGVGWSPVAELPRRERPIVVSCLFSAPWAGCSSPPQRPGCKRKRSVAFREEEEEGEPATEAQDTWVVESLSGLKMKLKRQRVSSVLPEHHEVFNRMLEDPVIRKFLAWDKNLQVSDKYLLSMVIAYFSRAGLFSWQFQRIHFFIALYVANDMEEDNQAPKQAIFSFLYGKNRSQRPLFHKLRLQFIRSMGWNARVTREECEQIQAFDPELWVWGRDRALLSQSPGEMRMLHRRSIHTLTTAAVEKEWERGGESSRERTAHLLGSVAPQLGERTTTCVLPKSRRRVGTKQSLGVEEGKSLGEIMANRQPSSQVEDQDSQPSSSGYPLEVTVNEESPGPSEVYETGKGRGVSGGRRSRGVVGWSPVAEFPRRERPIVVSCLFSAPWAGCSSPPQRPGCKRKRSVAFREEEEEGEPATEAQDTWVVESLSGLKMKLKRQRVSSVLPEHHEVFNRMLAPWAGCSSPPQRPGCKRKRSVAFREEEEEGEPATEAQDTWVVESLSGLKMKLKRQRVSSVLPEHHEVFNRMLEDPVIRKFLAWDKNLQVSDKYLLSMVIAYFSRAGLFSWQFQRIHFFIALYVANDMEEDNQAPKQAIFSFLYGKNRSQRPLFHKLRLQFIRSMGWNARVTREECEQVGGLWRSGGGAGPERRWGSWGIRSGTWRRTRKNRTRGTGRQRHPHFQGLFVFPDPGF
ncbi:uncharacterized protein LOC118881678 [Balaenoptera musculus]|uniref:Uncharacterized protein LOC118881678 n=1 Tax=Balaenoptera musculus TaxID=9771 RepID=A0A8B8VCS1_BALMU|nr:uncharacterized protein LOC118881678 [Balaenoptera musculus]